MKHIPLKYLDDPKGQVPTIDYKAVLTEVVRRPLDPTQGADIAELRQSIRVLDALDAANGQLELEDSDYDTLVTKLKAMQWNVVDRRLVQLVDDVLGAS